MNPTLDSAIHRLEFAWGGPPVSARLRASAEDFLVQEIPLVEPAGQGEHIWLLIRKRLKNTEQVAGALARLACVPPRDVSFAGQKDRNAVTEQWFSVRLPGGSEPDWTALNCERITLLRHARHNRKLRRGVLRGNAFRIRIRDITGDVPELERRLTSVAAGGVPNYFGEQRFGRGGSNLLTAGRLFSDTAGRLSRVRRGLALSAARSYLFNQVLARRVASHNWNRPLPGEALQLDGSHSYFIASVLDETLQQRVCEGDVHPTGPLYGRGESPATGEALQLESACLAPFETWCQGLVEAGLRQERRSLRLPVGEPDWTWPQPDCLEISFRLPAGAYATSVLRELVRSGDRQ